MACIFDIVSSRLRNVTCFNVWRSDSTAVKLAAPRATLSTLVTELRIGTGIRSMMTGAVASVAQVRLFM